MPLRVLCSVAQSCIVRDKLHFELISLSARKKREDDVPAWQDKPISGEIQM